MIAGAVLALAHLGLCLVALAAAAVSAFRARHGARTTRSGTRYRRITTPELLKRLGPPPAP